MSTRSDVGLGLGGTGKSRVAFQVKCGSVVIQVSDGNDEGCWHERSAQLEVTFGPAGLFGFRICDQAGH